MSAWRSGLHPPLPLQQGLTEDRKPGQRKPLTSQGRLVKNLAMGLLKQDFFSPSFRPSEAQEQAQAALGTALGLTHTRAMGLRAKALCRGWGLLLTPALALAPTLLILSGCGEAKQSRVAKQRTEKPRQPVLEEPAQRARQDLTKLPELQASELETYDREHFHRFAQVFGGYQTADLSQFLAARIKHPIHPSQVLDYEPPEIGAIISSSTELPGGKGKILANNLGTALWLSAESFQVPIWLSYLFQGEVIRVKCDSSRVGLIILPTDYGRDGRKAEERLLTLIHEGPHSDCPQGWSNQQARRYASAMRSGGNSPGELGAIMGTCGYPHALCPEDGPVPDLAGIPACDRLPWGSYAIEALFADRLAATSPSAEQSAIYEAAFYECKSRILLDYNALQAGAYGSPNLQARGRIAGSAPRVELPHDSHPHPAHRQPKGVVSEVAPEEAP